MSATTDTSAEPSYTGSCLCGGVKYSVFGDLEPVQLCYCGKCRKSNGAVFASNVPVPAASFRVDSGGNLITMFESSPGKQRKFCKQCGSPLFISSDASPGVLRLRMGLIDEDARTAPAFHFYTASKPNWWTIEGDLPRYPGAAPQNAVGRQDRRI
ncbi:hypothetical protein MSPP1_002176 [Malassezia sp. CBS 17886]|nr:hypothetical protein MSPP1_002176 [Malassezia sp. CBS 17886]